MELRFQIQAVQEFSRFELPELVQFLFPQELLQKTRDSGCVRENVYSRQSGTILPQPSSSSGRVLKYIPVETRCLNRASSKNFEN